MTVVTRVVKYIRKGTGVARTEAEYADSTSNTTAPTTGWNTVPPTWQNGHYIWQRIKTVFTDNSYTYSNAVCITGGKGISSVTEHYLATAASSGVTKNTSGWTTTVQSVTSTNKYLWNYETVTYTDGTTSDTTPVIIGVYGDKGNPGNTGNGISSVTEHYLATSASSGVTKNTSGWTTSIQSVTASNKYLWNYETITYTNGTTADTTPVIIGVYGDKGDPGDKGEKGPSLRIQNWADCPTNMYFYAGGNGETYKDVVVYNGNYYSCTQTHSKQSGVLPTNSDYWVLGDKIELVATNVLLATYSLIKNLGAEAIEMKDGNGNVVFSAKNGTVTCNTGNFSNVTVSGTLSGVTGSFKTLNCVNASGTVVGKISFGSDGKMWFEGDLYNQGYDSTLGRGYRFYSADIWCRGGFGARQRNVLYVLGSYGYYYTKGTGSSGVYVSFTSATSSGGDTYYTLKCYGDSGDYAGFPVDMIIFKISSGTYRYNLSMADTQRVLCINANDDENNVIIYSNGNQVTWNGGSVAEVIKVPTDFMYPTPNSSWLGRGILIGAVRDNNWG